ncbi:hypothetical protein K438DRAFT_1851111, partial [Mycena galopus ATCC 62051]
MGSGVTARSGFGERLECRGRVLGEGMELTKMNWSYHSTWYCRGSGASMEWTCRWTQSRNGDCARKESSAKIFLLFCLSLFVFIPALPSLQTSSFLIAQEWGAL